MSGATRLLADLKRRLKGVSRLRQYELAAPLPLSDDMSDIERLFWSNKGAVVHKWLHYLPLYDRYLSKYRGTAVKMLEIGVYKGGSLHLWREYLGPEAVIFGIDIDPSCAAFDGIDGQVRIGSQADPAFLARVVAEMGGVDIVLDDGSHIGRHMRASLDALYPHLSDGGLYLVEDVHCAYNRRYDGRFSRHNFIRLLGRLTDDIHHWYHTGGQKVAATADRLLGLHIHDSLVVLEKGVKARPAHIQVGTQISDKTQIPAMAGAKTEADAES
jgi:hypothetical protein